MTTKKIYMLCGAVLILSILFEVLFVHHHVYYWWHGLIGFDVLYGFLGGLVLIMLAKGLGKLFVQKHEGYYDGGEEDHD